MCLSVLTAFFLWNSSEFLASYFFKELRCRELLRYLALAIPFASIHACINGYFMGLQRAEIPGASQLLEQAVRMLSAFLLFRLFQEKELPITPFLAVAAMICAELASCLFTLTLLLLNFSRQSAEYHFPHPEKWLSVGKTAIPLSLNRLLISFLQSVEAMLIPRQLKLFGYTSTQALSQYGILNGMALPLVLFPTAITNAISMMLIPTVSKAHSLQNRSEIARTVEATIRGSLILGIFCTGTFCLFGRSIGQILFGSVEAGEYILILGWICPFLYLSTTLASILNGLGKTFTTFIQNALGLSIRILAVCFGIPIWGMAACLFGLLLSQLFVAALSLHSLRKQVDYSIDLVHQMIYPALSLLAAWSVLTFLDFFLSIKGVPLDSFAIVLLRGGLFTMVYAVLTVFLQK